jgi:hypothetical protein
MFWNIARREKTRYVIHVTRGAASPQYPVFRLSRRIYNSNPHNHFA